MTSEDSNFDKIAALFGLKQKSNADGVNSIHALGSLSTHEQLTRHARQNEAVINAYWKSKCGDSYEAPEEDMSNNFVNCSIVSDAAISQLASVINDGGGPSIPVEPPPTAKPKTWWKVVIATLAAVIIGAAIVFLVAQYFLNAGDGQQYEIIAVDEPFESPQPFTGQ